MTTDGPRGDADALEPCAIEPGTIEPGGEPESGPELTITVVPGAPHIVKVLGELDLATASRLRNQLRRLDGDVELDFTGLEFLDSSGMNTLVDAHRERVDQRRRLVIRGASGIVLRAMALTGLTGVLDLES